MHEVGCPNRTAADGNAIRNLTEPSAAVALNDLQDLMAEMNVRTNAARVRRMENSRNVALVLRRRTLIENATEEVTAGDSGPRVGRALTNGVQMVLGNVERLVREMDKRNAKVRARRRRRAANGSV